MILNIPEIHEKIYAHLRKNHSNLRFRLRQDIPRNKQKLLDGFWFWGDERTLQISFWRGSDGYQKTYMMGWSWWFEEPKGYVFFVGRDSDIRAKHFEKAVEVLSQEKELKLTFEKDKGKAVWRAKIDAGEPIASLDLFIKSIYPKIDDYFNQNPLPKSDNDVDENGGNLKDYNIKITDAYFNKSVAVIDSFRNKLKEVSLVEKKVKNPLPVSIQRIFVSNYQGIENLELLNLPRNAQWIFITGENGFGKTSLLKAIATGLVDTQFLYGNQSDIQIAFFCKDKNIAHRVFNPMKLGEEIAEDEVNEDEVATEDNTDMVAPSKETIPPIAMYGVTRISNKYSTIIPKSVTQSLFENEAIFYDIQNELKIIEKRDNKRFEMLKNALTTIIPSLEDISIDKKGENVFYKEKDNSQLVTLDKLGAGLQGTVNLIGDIVKRLEAFDYNKKAEKLEDLIGIVLIDEIDANLHPNYQYEIPQLLSKVFPKVQFIAITHSPIPLLGAMKLNPVVLTVTRDIENGIQVQRWDNKIDLDVLMPNAILSSPIFNFETLFSTAFNEKKQRIRTEDYYNDVVYHNRLQKDLDDLAGTEREDELLNFLKSKNN